VACERWVRMIIEELILIDLGEVIAGIMVSPYECLVLSFFCRSWKLETCGLSQIHRHPTAKSYYSIIVCLNNECNLMNISSTTTFGVVFHIFPIDFPHCCHAFDDSYHRLYVTNLYQNMGKLRVRGVAKVWARYAW